MKQEGNYNYATLRMGMGMGMSSACGQVNNMKHAA
jgi:hypothetical protein